MAPLFQFGLIVVVFLGTNAKDEIDFSNKQLLNSILDECEKLSHEDAPKVLPDKDRILKCNNYPHRACPGKKCVSVTTRSEKWACCQDGDDYKCTVESHVLDMCGDPPVPFVKALEGNRAIVKWIMPNTTVPILDYTLQYKVDGGPIQRLSGLTSTNVTLPNTVTGTCEARVRARGIAKSSRYTSWIKFNMTSEKDREVFSIMQELINCKNATYKYFESKMNTLMTNFDSLDMKMNFTLCFTALLVIFTSIIFCCWRKILNYFERRRGRSQHRAVRYIPVPNSDGDQPQDGMSGHEQSMQPATDQGYVQPPTGQSSVGAQSEHDELDDVITLHVDNGKRSEPEIDGQAVGGVPAEPTLGDTNPRAALRLKDLENNEGDNDNGTAPLLT